MKKKRTSRRRSPPRRKLRSTPKPSRTGKHGGQLRTGNPGNKGGGGISNEWKDRLDGLLDKAERSTYMKRCASGRFGWKAFAWAVGYCSGYVRGKPVQPVTGGDGGPIAADVTFHFA